jgi:hypothetical protein
MIVKPRRAKPRCVDYQTTGHFDVGHQTRFCKCMIFRLLERKSNVQCQNVQ